MLRRFLPAAVVALLAATAAPAETYGDKVKSVDVDKKTLTLPVDGKDKTFTVDDKAEIQTQVRAGKRLRLQPLKEGLKGVKAGAEVTLTTEKKDGKEVVTRIVVLAGDK
jgi:hypothetical protein